MEQPILLMDIPVLLSVGVLYRGNPAAAFVMVSAKVIRNKHTGLSEGYGFVEFPSHDAADKVLKEFDGTTMPSTEQPFRLNWASFSTGEKRLETNGPVYGSVRFGDDNERTKAMTEMNGVKCSSRAMRIGPATPRKTTGYPQQGVYMANGPMMHPDGDSLNTTIFVGGLDSSVTDEDLKQPFSAYGEIVSVKIPFGKGCGFVQFVNRPNAEEALEKLNGTVIGKQSVRLSWGRSPANKQLPRTGEKRSQHKRKRSNKESCSYTTFKQEFFFS